MKLCGNPKCKTSTGIHEGVTHGWGELDLNGFWEHECGPCTAAEKIREALAKVTAERDRLRAALSALVERYKPTEGRWGLMGCDECGSEWDETETHGPDCRWSQARDALEGSK